MDSANQLIAEAEELREIASVQDEEDAQEFYLALAEAYELLAADRPRRRAKRA